MAKEPNNIFSLASSQKPKRPEKPQPLPPSHTSVQLPPNQPDPEIDEALAKVQRMHDDLEQKIQLVYTRMGLTKETIKRMLDNPKNFEQMQLTYEHAQNQRKILRQEIIKMAGKDVLESMEDKAQKRELDRHRKKTLGSRKNWLDMR